MGIADRDWFREKPSSAWTDLVRGSDESPHARRTSGEAYDRRQQPKHGLRRFLVRMAVALLIAVAVLVGWAYRGQLRHAIKDTTNSHPAAQIAPLSPLLGTPPATNLVRLKPRAGLNIPVKVVTEWSTTDPRFGRISVYVPVGETPRKALTVALAQRGFQVVG